MFYKHETGLIYKRNSKININIKKFMISYQKFMINVKYRINTKF